MNESRLRAALHELDKLPVPSAIPAAVQRRAKHRRLGFVLGGSALACVVAGGLAFAASLQEPSTNLSPSATQESSASEDGFSDWRVEVWVEPSSIGPLGISVSEVSNLTTGGDHSWVHELILENLGKEILHFDDTRSSAVLPSRDRPILLAADEGCGYGRASATSVMEPACRDYLDAFSIAAGGKESRAITLSKELPGMAEMQEGTYVFIKTLRFRVGGDSAQEHELRVMYRIDRADS
jgi:hypothetical protein